MLPFAAMYPVVAAVYSHKSDKTYQCGTTVKSIAVEAVRCFAAVTNPCHKYSRDFDLAISWLLCL